ncbi:hypothetical protein [uncultured Cohaesibacter sp.]|uniref:hypothetical protein n=1 Tax=uncultured Cohaesibacter sp. TaxID=1002546 RepID=UPI0029C907B9|nr:hypothetical protein [uncultured Cohaesibacter sp.]
MFDLSLPGMVGALIGGVIGWADYKMIGGLVGAKWMKARSDKGLARHPDTKKFGDWIQFGIWCGTQLLFPFIGYWAGASLAG